MDEVDKIIIHSLRDIGCKIDDDTTGIAEFTPELVARAAAACLQQIKPNSSLPISLPAGMAQRFAAATTLAEECAAAGYRSDIGYQSFLYPNTVDVRRLFMFLIEQLPKENQFSLNDKSSKTPSNEYEKLRRGIKDKIKQQLRCPWVPDYCRVVGNRRSTDYGDTSHVQFSPQLNLNIPDDTESLTPEVKTYLQQQAPSVFQQNASCKDYDLISTVLHKNAHDLYATNAAGTNSNTNSLKYSLCAINFVVAETAKVSDVNVEEEQQQNANEEEPAAVEKPRSVQLQEKLNTLKCQNDEIIVQHKTQTVEIRMLKQRQNEIEKAMEQLRAEAKIHERTCVVLEQPEENVEKLVRLVQTTKERRKTLERQWHTYREPLLENLTRLHTSKQARNAQNVADLREVIAQLELTLSERTDTHAKLVSKLKNAEIHAAPRMEYTRRILEFIGNIKKQQNDIFKVLDDTRELQKQLNSVTAQLERQFNYTDDLLFQSAKHDVHAKKAYKLLASLHATCNELVELVSQTGIISKEIRELEVQIQRERDKNVTVNLAQISSDIQNFRNVIKSLQLEIRKIEQEKQANNVGNL